MDEIFIKEKILELKRQISHYEQELINVCEHKKLSLMFYKYPEPQSQVVIDDYIENSNNKYTFICEDCGMTFVTNDPKFKYKRGK